ncbi:hypothetical protein HDU99_002733 [Rhizoclosmatium hyalinum]|nr:hypothetical protein HDU99_002733 [Rhizoclosmatium hyalinum]
MDAAADESKEKTRVSVTAAPKKDVTVKPGRPRRQVEDTFFSLDMAAVSAAPQPRPGSGRSEAFFVDPLDPNPPQHQSGSNQPENAEQSATNSNGNIDSDQQASANVDAARIEQLVIQLASDPRAALKTTLLDTPPPFGAKDFSVLIEQVLKQVAVEMGVNIRDVAAAHVPGAVASKKDSPNNQLGLTPAQMSLKIKTLSYTNTELGKKLEIANNSISSLISRIAELEGEKCAALLIVERIKKENGALELRAKTAEGAVNAYNQEFKQSVEAFQQQLIQNHSNPVESATEGPNAETPANTDAPNENPTPSSIESMPKIISVKLHQSTAPPSIASTKITPKHKSRKLTFTDFSSDEGSAYNSEMEQEGYASDDPTKITKKVIHDTAKMLAAKKKFDPPTILSVGLKACLEKEELLCNPNSPINPTTRSVPPNPNSLPATSYRPSNTVPRLAHQSTDHVHHLSNVLSAQTQQLLSATTPQEYLRILHTQLEGMTHSLHETLDALAEERRIRETWRARWEKASWELKKEITKRKKEAEEREGWRYRGTYLVNALEPIGSYRGTVDMLEDVMGTMGVGGGGIHQHPSSHYSGRNSPTKMRIVETGDHYPKLTGTLPHTSENLHRPMMGNFVDDPDAGDRWESRARSVNSGHTNRPRYQSNISSPNDANRQRFTLGQGSGDKKGNSTTRIPTAKTEINAEYMAFTDPRLVEVASSKYTPSIASSGSFASGLTGSRKGSKKANYSVPSVSSVVPFENPLIKKRFRKKSPASAGLQVHWGTSDRIL